MRIPLCYVAGPYRAPSAWIVELNIREAEKVAYQVAVEGAYPVTPHTNTRGYFECINQTAEFWLEATLELMRRCDIVLMMDTWERSSGARGEHAEAHRLGKPVLYSLHELRVWLAGPRVLAEGDNAAR